MRAPSALDNCIRRNNLGISIRLHSLFESVRVEAFTSAPIHGRQKETSEASNVEASNAIARIEHRARVGIRFKRTFVSHGGGKDSEDCLVRGGEVVVGEIRRLQRCNKHGRGNCTDNRSYGANTTDSTALVGIISSWSLTAFLFAIDDARVFNTTVVRRNLFVKPLQLGILFY